MTQAVNDNVITLPVNPMALQHSAIAPNPLTASSTAMGTVTAFDSRELNALKTADDQREALNNVAEQFESLFLQMVLKQMRQANEAMGDDESMWRSRESKTYQSFFDGQIAMEMAKRNNGLAEVIVRQLAPTLGMETEAEALKQGTSRVDLMEQGVNTPPLPSAPLSGTHQSSAFAQPLISSLQKEYDV